MPAFAVLRIVHRHVVNGLRCGSGEPVCRLIVEGAAD